MLRHSVPLVLLRKLPRVEKMMNFDRHCFNTMGSAHLKNTTPYPYLGNVETIFTNELLLMFLLTINFI